ncbi:protein NO VEIN-like [Juglans microcarpa x Juglans regia]|uniref:protein NO VEIN-like n=1 Tax=Juglans microcarpa x Juglans regia TaxID=2249226 RepID=UPI001B7EDBDC|nr:protein NO VEIN-like [Juglans microcarpa x Juglans regia]
MEEAREHIKDIRRTKFSIGGTLNPLTEDLHQAVKNLSAELYAKDVHFLMELIQNAEDNDYAESVDPSLEFIIVSEDITATGAPATLLIFNNEKGFSSKNIDSICSVGRSTKKGYRKRGYIGEKGIGFKSVFLVTSRPYIFSNGYQIRFNEEPCPHCNLGYIVPEWVEENPTFSDIQQIYGSTTTLPMTTIVIPLKPDKVKAVKQQLSSIHPEVLLFLSKIKRLSVREHNEDPRLNTVSAIAITSETDLVTRKNMDADSYTLHLSAEEKDQASDRECSYYMWKQKFPVRQENRVERRMEVEELVITLAFPVGARLHMGMTSPGIYAFLPTEMVTNFPFIIQADFLLASSRETILLDSKWNQGILDCVPSAFFNAFVSLVRNSVNAPVSSLVPMFRFIPVDHSSYQVLNTVRQSIKAKLVEENIVPSESYSQQKFFHKPCEVGRLMPDFWRILDQAREQKVNLHNLSSHGMYILSSSFDLGSGASQQ